MNTFALLDAAKVRAGVSSDYALAARLHVTRGAISGYRAGRTVPDTLIASRLADLLGVDPYEVIAVLEAEKADRRGSAAQVAEWRHILAERGIDVEKRSGSWLDKLPAAARTRRYGPICRPRDPFARSI